MMIWLESVSNRIARLMKHRWVLPALIFALAVLPRLVGLNTFLTADEDDQLRFSAEFLRAMVSHDWQGMLVLGYPGVPTLALGALGLAVRYGAARLVRLLPAAETVSPLPAADLPHRVFLPLVQVSRASGLETMLSAIPNHPLDFIVWVRLPMVLAASITILLIFLLLRKLLPEKTAILAAILVAFDPFFLANSRVIHVDAPLTYFMFAAFLAFLVYLKAGRWQRLLLSGILGGLAALSKSPAFILAPILAVGGGLYLWRMPGASRKNWRRGIFALAAWGAILMIAFVVFWPSMWAKPFFAITWIVQNALGAVSAPHPSSGKFWGTLVTDRSPWYYAVAVPFLLTPLTTGGLFLGGMAALRGRKSASFPRAFGWALVAFVIIFLFGVSIPARRLVRYTLPIFPALDVLAALGLVWLAKQTRKRWAEWALAGVVFTQVAQVLLFAPYFFDYTNPLLGGGRTAPKFVVMGWGEGLDRAAAYLNQKPDAPQKTVAAWYSWQFAHFFSGKTVDLASNEPAYTADYTVFYINQIQRRFPSEELLDYFADRVPEKIIRLGGMDYATIYPGPIIGQTLPDKIAFPLGTPLNQALLLGGVDFVPPGLGTLPVMLFWQPLDTLPPNLNVSIRMEDATGEVWGQVDRLPIGGLVRTQNWQPGTVICDEYLLHFNPLAPPGNYFLAVQMYDFETGDVFGEIKQAAQVAIFPPAKPVTAVQFNDWVQNYSVLPVTVLPVAWGDGLTLEAETFANFETLPGYRTTFKLMWHADKPFSAPRTVALKARAADGTEISLADIPIGPETDPPAQWRRGERMGQTVSLRIPADMPPGEYALRAESSGAVAELGGVTVRAQAHTFSLPAGVTPATAQFGADISLAGYTIGQKENALNLTLFWKTARLLDDDLKIFVHVTDAAGNIIAQRDGIPADGARPTLTWVAGEIIADNYQIPLEAQNYSVWVGLYNPLSGERLAVNGGGLPVSENRLRIANGE